MGAGQFNQDDGLGGLRTVASGVSDGYVTVASWNPRASRSCTAGIQVLITVTWRSFDLSADYCRFDPQPGKTQQKVTIVNILTT